MNKGLKNYTKQIPITVGNAAETSVNINKNDANLHISVPLIATVGLSPIETILTFNLQDRNVNGEFGKGFKLNFYKKIRGTTVYNYDGSSDNYTYWIENKETGLTLDKIKDDNYGAYHYEIEDKYKNKFVFNNNQDYPQSIFYKNGNRTYIDFIAATKIIKNGKGDEIRFKKNGESKITLVEYYHNNSLVNSVEITYDVNDFISKITYKNGSEVVATTSLEFSERDVIVIDDLSGYRVKYSIDNNRVTSIINGYDVKFTNSHRSTIEYFDTYTLLTDYEGNKSYSFFDGNNLPKFELDEKGNVVETEYDSQTKCLKSNSGTINVNKINNLLVNNDLSTFTNDGLIITKVNPIDSIFANAIKGNVYKVSGSGTLRKSIKVKGLATDNTLALLFAKQLTPTTENSYVSVSLKAGDCDTDNFEKNAVDNLFSLMTLGVNAKRSYDEIVLEITLCGGAEIEIGGIQITNKEFASFYQYDESGNTNNLGCGGKTTDINYGSNNLPSRSIGIDSTLFDYTYDDRGNLIEGLTSYGAKIKNEYDSNNNLISNKIINKLEDKILETKKTFTPDGRFVASETDELGNTTTYNEYDSFGKIKKITNALGAISTFDYNNDGTLNNIILEKGTTSSQVKYKYDDKKRLSKVTLTNGSFYDFVYDNYNNIKEIKLNNNLVFSYEYDENTGNLIKQKYGPSGDAYLFSYNNKKLIECVTYENKNSSKVTKFKYFYNDYDQLIRVEDGNGNLLIEYVYDEDEKIIETKTTKSSIKNTYDNLGNVCTKAVQIDNKKIYQAFDTVSRSKGSHPGAIYEPFKNLDAYIGMFEKDGNLKCYSETKSLIPVINHNGENENLSTILDGVIPCIEVNSSNRLSYQLKNHNYFDTSCGNICFWFKTNTPQSSTTKEYLFSVHTSLVGNHTIFGDNILFKDFIGIYLQNKRIYLEVIDINNNHYDLITSEYDVDLSKWNFISLNFMNRCEGQGYGDICEYALVVNAHRQTFQKQNPRIYVDIDPLPTYNIGHKFDGTNCSNDFSGKITGLMIGKRTYLPTDSITKFYRLTKDYIIDNQLVDSDAKTVDFSQTNLYSIDQCLLNLFDIYPLHNNVTSLNRKKPIEFDIRNISILDKDRTFNFNPITKRYAYVADGSRLVYDFDMLNSGTIAMRAFTDVSENKQYFFEGKDSTNKIIGLYRNKNHYLIVDVNGHKIETNLKFASNKWQSVALSFKENIISSSNPIKNLDLRIVLDDKSWSYNMIISNSYTNLKFIIGRKFEFEYLPMSFDPLKTYCEFHGQMEMLSTRPAYCDLDTIENLFEGLKGITKTSEFDEFGMLKKVDIHQCGQSILSNTYEFKTRNSDPKYISKQIKSEKIIFGTNISNRSYESDALGNITQINDSIFGNHNYVYDYRGFLIEADGETYAYDGNGNIVRKGNKTLVYDPVIKDRLMSFNGENIEYDTSNPLNPKTYNGKTYEFEGRRLTKFIYGGGHYKFNYNDQGLRIRKEDCHGVGTDYIYDGNKLISEISSNHRLDFLYDENGSLYGFIKDMSQKFLYIRDSLQNILGICDINGNLVVKYKYNPWGQILEVSGSNVSLGNLNPFKYKGYYYDNETGMYYCESRYYVPEWGRWLNIDSPINLSLDEINGTNLYLYCGNNPVICVDGSGKWLLFSLLCGVVGAVVNTVTSIITSLVTEQKIDWKESFSSGVGGFVSGFIIGATGGSAVAVASYASAAVTSATSEIIDYATGEKELNANNILDTFGKIALDTAVNGSISLVSDKFLNLKFPSIKTNKGWFKPKKVSSFFTKSYGRKIIKGALLGGVTSSSIDISLYYLEKFNGLLTNITAKRNPKKIFN